MSAAYLFSIVKNHPFIDGIKRAGPATALSFLDVNGIALDHSSDLLYDATMAVAEGRLGKEELATLFRRLTSSSA
jgi:death-on-curing protein